MFGVEGRLGLDWHPAGLSSVGFGPIVGLWRTATTFVDDTALSNESARAVAVQSNDYGGSVGLHGRLLVGGSVAKRKAADLYLDFMTLTHFGQAISGSAGRAELGVGLSSRLTLALSGERAFGISKQREVNGSAANALASSLPMQSRLAFSLVAGW